MSTLKRPIEDEPELTATEAGADIETQGAGGNKKIKLDSTTGPEAADTMESAVPAVVALGEEVKEHKEGPEVEASMDASSGSAPSKFRARIDNLSKYANKKEIQKLCEKANVPVPSIKKAPDWEFCYLMFESQEARDYAIEKLNGLEHRKQNLDVTVLHDATPRQGTKVFAGRAQRDVATDGANDGRTREERVADAVTPLWNTPYEQQLAIKQQAMTKAMNDFRNRLTKYFHRSYRWQNAADPEPDALIPEDEDQEGRTKRQLGWLAQQHRMGRDHVPCTLLPVIPSPVTDHYRNKCEYTFGWNEAGEKVAGFLCGAYKNGVVTVVEAEIARNVSPAGAELAKSLTRFLRSSSLDVYDRITKTGFWRQALVRTHSTKENMVIISYNPTGVDAAGLEAAHDELRKHFEPEKDSPTGATTLLVQQHAGDFNGMVEDAPLIILYGAGVVHETILGLRFRISPTAFFQVNTEATNTLYSLVRDWCALAEVTAGRGTKVLKPIPAGLPPPGTELDPSAEPLPPHPKNLSPPGTILLDLCCGTGTIGLTMASHVKKVIGVDMIKAAIEDARFNVELNGGNAEGKVVYYAEKVETVIKEIVREHVGVNDDVVVVLDPPRAGVYYDVIRTVRACKEISRVVYVSCDASQAVANFNDLCRPTSNKFRGEPFRPIRAQPLDLFPHTKHCELVIEFRR